ncbi:MAG: hypothetical protein GTO51_06175 [Candidatus Latescibacteria bacterium]|nr:hypothetical protein [Candidatus Latescibacterota bacterium]NIM21377.1 hypothetical protein [Candidatus Latescibacterota bacterium]NIM65558.1 hypothetical protein [Candidatus Latescibacterota bacterium]NIO01938.1 hypothetical protein [Candidatus Latescibacterota bacterium]NIO28751.1 hypothetical protein [Candidatus Latescibacterota bacterium]
MCASTNIKVIAHYIDGNLLKGTTLDFQPSKPFFHIRTPEGDVHKVELKELKAVFFVKALEGSTTYNERKGFLSKRDKGRKVLIEFSDGEVIFGYTLSYTSKGLGFFIIPGDPNSNNEKVFIVHSATKRVKIQVTPAKVRK